MVTARSRGSRGARGEKRTEEESIEERAEMRLEMRIEEIEIERGGRCSHVTCNWKRVKKGDEYKSAHTCNRFLCQELEHCFLVVVDEAD